MLELGINYFGIMDYIFLAATLLISLLVGLYYGYTSKHTNEDLLVGSRNMSLFPVAASVMVTYLSAITVLGFPSEIYAHGAQIFMMEIVLAVAVPISVHLFVPFFYKMKLTSINEYLERRYESKWIRWLASGIFILHRLVHGGVVLYSPSIALEAFLGFPMWISVFGIGTCATIYTSIGGLKVIERSKAVVWTDAFQFLMIVAGLIGICWKGISASGGLMHAYDLANERGRLQLFDFTFDPFTRHNFWNFVIGSGFHYLIQPSIQQLNVQRYSGMPSISKAKRAIIWSVPFRLLVMTLCLIAGFTIFVFYANCDPFTKRDIQKIDQIVPFFVVHEMRSIPGMMGIFTSCLFSGTLSSISSSLNSISAVTWEDFLSRLKYFRAMTPKAQTNVSRICGLFYGVVCMALAFSAQKMGAVYTATYSIVGVTAGTTYGIFLMALFMPFVNAVGAIVGALSGFACMIVIITVAFINKRASKPTLPLSVEECPVDELEAFYNSTTLTVQSYGTSAVPLSSDEWPWKVFQLSYLLYPVLAAAITIIVGTVVSFITSSCVTYYRNKKPLSSLIHPLVRSMSKRYTVPDTKDYKEYDKGEQMLNQNVPILENKYKSTTF